MADDRGIDLDIDVSTGGSAPPRRRGGVLVVLLGLLALVAAGTFAVVNAGEDQAAPEPNESDTETDPAPAVDATLSDIDAAGRYDGLDSIRLPLEVTPDSQLADGMTVAAQGIGYSPHALVGIIQCASIVEGEGSVNNCDLSNYVLGSADENGVVDMALEVRRYIATGEGEIDCALLTVTCSIAIGNVDNYDESGTAQVWFDPNVDGARSPVIAVAPATAIRDGDTLTVTGANFTPDDLVSLSQCVIGGSHSFAACSSPDRVTDEVVVGPDGTFVAEVIALRNHADGTDCFDDVYGCRVAAQGTLDAPNPVAIFFDGSERPPDGVSLTIEPSAGLVDGSVLTVSFTELPTGGEVQIQQCVDQGALGVTCLPEIVVTVDGGGAEASFGVARYLVNDQGDTVDCAATGRVCELRVTGAHEQTVPLRFEADE